FDEVERRGGMRTLAIGDIHGCYQALSALIQMIGPKPEDRLVFLGDYTRRGPDSKTVLHWMVNAQNRASTVFLRGNHEVMMLQAREGGVESDIWLGSNGFETLESYGITLPKRDGWMNEIPAAHWSFLEQTAPVFETPGHILVHACLDPGLDLKDQPSWLLYWETFDRLQPHKSGKKIICGHTRQKSGRINDVGYAACIDTGAATGGWLTCLDINSGEYWQTTQQGASRAGRMNW